MSETIETNDEIDTMEIASDIKNQFKKIEMSFVAFMDRTNKTLLDSDSIISYDLEAMKYFCNYNDEKIDTFKDIFNELITCKEIVEGQKGIYNDIKTFFMEIF
jgi:hypothetical protein